MTALDEIEVDAPATPARRRALIDLLQLVTHCDRSTGGSVVADTIELGRFTAETIALREQALAQAPGAAAPCPRCMGPRPPGTSGICRVCRQAMADRQRARDVGRTPPPLRLAPPPGPVTAPPLPEIEEQPASAPVLDRYDLEDVKRMCAGKRRYVSLLDAAKTKARCERDRPWHRLRVYACPACGGWHLTRSAAAPAHLEAR